MPNIDPSHEEVLRRSQSLVKASLHLWPMPADARARLINVSENFTYLIEGAGGYRAVLRLHRPGYHTRRAIESELNWLEALGQEGVVSTAHVLVGRDGDRIQEVTAEGWPELRFMVLFEYLPGTAPDETGDLIPLYLALGAMAARCHDHAARWPRPKGFERLAWDDEAVFGPTPTWGDWREAPGITSRIAETLEQTEQEIHRRLTRYGKGADRYGLIHADMRFANLLVDDAETHLIDFDDCGFGWFLYDFAAAVSFIEDDPRLPEFKAAWLAGYRTVRPLRSADEAEIDTFVMLRRLALLAWIGSHIDAPEPQRFAPDFARNTERLAREWLARQAGA